MFGKESFDILKDQLNLYSVQVNPNRSANISETEIRQFVGILIRAPDGLGWAEKNESMGYLIIFGPSSRPSSRGSARGPP